MQHDPGDFAGHPTRGTLELVIDFFSGFSGWLLGLLLQVFLPICFGLLVFFAYKMWKAMPTTKPMKIEPDQRPEGALGGRGRR